MIPKKYSIYLHNKYIEEEEGDTFLYRKYLLRMADNTQKYSTTFTYKHNVYNVTHYVLFCT